MNTLLPPQPSRGIVPKPPRFKPRPPQPVTIVIGFACSDGIILACDSQHSFTTSSSAKRTDAVKVSLVEFENGSILVGQSGAVVLSKRYVEIFQEIALTRKIETPRTVPQTAQEAFRGLRNELRVQRDNCSMSELDEYLLAQGFAVECIVAHYFEGRPFIHTISLALSIPEPINGHYVAVGSGASLGEYLVDTHFDPARDVWFSTAVAVYVIETVKDYDSYCSGDTQVSVLKCKKRKGEFRTTALDVQNHVVESYAKAFEAIDGKSVMLEHFAKVLSAKLIAMNRHIDSD